jgi:positive regulator of sigma E activity
MGAHVERGGVKLHYAHDEATCASCQARSIHGTTRAADVALAPSSEVATTVATARVSVVAADQFSQDNPRAPPRLI